MPATVAGENARPVVATDERLSRPEAEPQPADSGLAAPHRPVAPKPLAVYPPLVGSDHASQSSPHRHGNGVAALGWVLTLAVLAALSTGFVLEREQIQVAWPPSQRLYAALGL